jgi:DNA-binding transcriptional ArsR family regulator
MKSDGNAYVVRNERQLAALASSARQEIIDVLSQMGTVSVAELASALGRPADSLYYHLKVLKEIGLVVAAGNREHGNRKEELLRAVSSDLRLQYDIGRERRKITAIASSMLRLGIRDFRSSIQSSKVKLSGPGRELWALRKTGWLTSQEIGRVNQRIEGLANDVSKPRGRGRLYAITVLLTPLDHRARSSGKKPTARKKKT